MAHGRFLPWPFEVLARPLAGSLDGKSRAVKKEQ